MTQLIRCLFITGTYSNDYLFSEINGMGSKSFLISYFYFWRGRLIYKHLFEAATSGYAPPSPPSHDCFIYILDFTTFVNPVARYIPFRAIDLSRNQMKSSLRFVERGEIWSHFTGSFFQVRSNWLPPFGSSCGGWRRRLHHRLRRFYFGYRFFAILKQITNKFIKNLIGFEVPKH